MFLVGLFISVISLCYLFILAQIEDREYYLCRYLISYCTLGLVTFFCGNSLRKLIQDTVGFFKKKKKISNKTEYQDTNSFVSMFLLITFPSTFAISDLMGEFTLEFMVLAVISTFLYFLIVSHYKKMVDSIVDTEVTKT